LKQYPISKKSLLFQLLKKDSGDTLSTIS